MPAPVAAPNRTDRDPAVIIWGVAGACWALVAGIVLAGGAGPCHEGIAPVTWPWPARLAAPLAAWLMMIGAMMLPTVVPLVRLFVPVTACVPHRFAARIALLAGYLAMWIGFAVVALLGERAVDRLFGSAARSELVLGITLVVAGVFQFSSWKHACLATCRSPWAFLWRYYRRGLRGAWMLGVRHGMFCLGCCWALMLVMVGTGVGSMFWMLTLTGAMIVEKTVPEGTRLVAPLGGALVLSGVAVSLPAIWAALAHLPWSTARLDGTGTTGEVALVVAVGLATLWPLRAATSRHPREPRPNPPEDGSARPPGGRRRGPEAAAGGMRAGAFETAGDVTDDPRGVR
jgi:predicted metal-binding membrane protein